MLKKKKKQVNLKRAIKSIVVQVVPEHGRSHEVRGTLNLVALDFFLNVSVRFPGYFS